MISPHITVDQLNAMKTDTLMAHLDMEFTEVGSDYISAKMPIDHRHRQPYGLLHGGASVALAETLGSVAAHFSVNTETQVCVGIEVNANHVRSVRSGYVYGTAKPLHTGKKIQVWEIKITNERQQLVCVCRLTVSVLDKK